MSNTSTVGYDHWRVHYYEWEGYEVYSFRTENQAREMAQELMYGGEDQWIPQGKNQWCMSNKMIKVKPYSFERDLQELEDRKESHN